jgi:DNA-binding beta-propeller fold protein YncE
VRSVAGHLAPGVISSNPVLLLATGLSVPDDLLYLATDGTVLVGEHGNGHIAKVGGPGGVTRLPQVVPQAEGIAKIGDTIYVADQVHNRVVALTSTGVRTVIQLRPDPSGLNLDGIDANGTQLIVPDSPHGTVLFVDPSGRVTAREGGFLRPVGVWANPTGQVGRYLIADENANAVFELKNAGGHTKLAGNLPGVDDVVRDSSGHVLVTLPGLGKVRDVTSGRDIARGLRNPQGLGFDGAQNLLVTESDAGRLDLVVKTFAIQVPAPAVKLVPGQAVCLGILRAAGFTAPLNVEEIIGATIAAQPSGAASFEVVPGPCDLPVCTASVVISSPAGREFAYFTYRD